MATPTAPAPSTAALSAAELERFRRDGYLGPYELCSPDAMAARRPAIERVLATDPPHGERRVHNRHLDSRAVYDLATHPEIVERMVCLYGPDLLLWRTNFFVKNRGSKAIPWHQDFNYWPLEAAGDHLTPAWIAVDPSTRQNGNLPQVIPRWLAPQHRPARRGHPRRAIRGDGGRRLLRPARFRFPNHLEMQPGQSSSCSTIDPIALGCTTRRPTCPLQPAPHRAGGAGDHPDRQGAAVRHRRPRPAGR